MYKIIFKKFIHMLKMSELSILILLLFNLTINVDTEKVEFEFKHNLFIITYANLSVICV